MAAAFQTATGERHGRAVSGAQAALGAISAGWQALGVAARGFGAVLRPWFSRIAEGVGTVVPGVTVVRLDVRLDLRRCAGPRWPAAPQRGVFGTGGALRAIRRGGSRSGCSVRYRGSPAASVFSGRGRTAISMARRAATGCSCGWSGLGGDFGCPANIRGYHDGPAASVDVSCARFGVGWAGLCCPSGAMSAGRCRDAAFRQALGTCVWPICRFRAAQGYCHRFANAIAGS